MRRVLLQWPASRRCPAASGPRRRRRRHPFIMALACGCAVARRSRGTFGAHVLIRGAGVVWLLGLRAGGGERAVQGIKSAAARLGDEVVLSPKSLRTLPAGFLNAIASAVLPLKTSIPTGRPSGSVSKACPICALTPGSAISESAIRGRLHMFAFDSRNSAACRAHAHGRRRPVRVRRDITRPPFRHERAGRDRHGV